MLKATVGDCRRIESTFPEILSRIFSIIRLYILSDYIKVFSERLGDANIGITLDIYSHVLQGLQEAAQRNSTGYLRQMLEKTKKAMLANDREVECRPYRSRTCDTLIKSQIDTFRVFRVLS